MSAKNYYHLFLFTLFGISMWFFGNFYEAIVLGPNMLENTNRRLHAWQQFFVTTNPVYYYVPLTQVATLTMLAVYFFTPAENKGLKRYLGWGSLFQLMSLVITLYIITQINFTIFFGNLDAHANEIASLAKKWNLLNGVRVIFTAFALQNVFKAFLMYDRWHHRTIQNLKDFEL